MNLAKSLVSSGAITKTRTRVLATRTTIVAEGKPAPLTDATRGKVVDRVLLVGGQMIWRFTDGTEVRVSSRDDLGHMVGVPVIDEIGKWN